MAASTYGGVIVYKRFDATWLTKKTETGEKLSSIVKDKWPGFFVEPLVIPENLCLAVAWTKESASTGGMIKQMDSFRQSNAGKYMAIYDSISHVVESLIDSWKSSDEEKMLDSIRRNRELLRQLTKESGVSIETPELRQLAEIAEKYKAAGKLSGAGGGDCGFAISFDKDSIEKVKQAWKQAGLYPIDTDIDKNGVRLEK